MLKENIFSVLDCPQFINAGQDFTIEQGHFVTHELYVARVRIKTGASVELIDRHQESLECRQPINLQFYSPHGLVMQAPIFRVGKTYAAELYDEIDILVTLTQEQLWALNLDDASPSDFGY